VKKEHIFFNFLQGFDIFPYILPCFWIAHVEEYLPLATGYSLAKNIQDVVKELFIAEWVTEAFADVMDAVNEHHPQILEPLFAPK
jgi:hypothetical protein